MIEARPSSGALSAPPGPPAQLAARVIPAIGRPEFSSLLLSIYRDLAECELGSAWMAEAGPILAAAVRRHNELMELAHRTVASPSSDAVVQWARKRGLSVREAQVVAGLVSGLTQAEIAESVELSVNSVITYRRRAYQKLKVADRRTLQALCERQLALR